MSKKLAIKGHVSRGKEIIELFKMMGGCECGYSGGVMDCYYYISQFGNIEASCKPYEFDTYIVYTLEEFLEKYPFKVGDKVIDEADGCPGVVCEMKWDEGLSDMKYCVAFGNSIDFGWYANNSINYFKIKKIENLEETQSNQDIDKIVDNLEKTSVKNHKMGPKSKLPSKYYEDKLEEIKSKREYNELKMPLNDNENKFPSFEPMFKMNDELEYKIPDGYEITEVSKNTVFIKPIKPNYPKTYEECAKIMNCPIAGPSGWLFNFDANVKNTYYRKKDILMGKFIRLLIYRDAYWKIAGEEMGLGKPWEPKFGKTILFDITFYFYQDNFMLHKGEYSSSDNRILVFPTEEMRDAFYENFKDLIGQCKELL